MTLPTGGNTDPTPPPADTPTPPPPAPPASAPTTSGNQFDTDAFFRNLDTRFNAFGENIVRGIREAFPAAPAPSNNNAANNGTETNGGGGGGDNNVSHSGGEKPPPPPADEEQPKTPGKKTFAERWFGL